MTERLMKRPPVRCVLMVGVVVGALALPRWWAGGGGGGGAAGMGLRAERAAERAPVQVAEVIYVGAESHYELRAGGQILRCEKMNNEGTDFEPGQNAWAYLPPAALTILDD